MLFRSINAYPGVGVYGNVINSVVNKRFIWPVERGINTLILILLGLMATYFFVPFRKIFSLVMAVVLMIGWMIIAFVVFCQQGLWLYLFQQLLLILVLFLFSAVYSFFFVEKEKTEFYRLAIYDGLTGLINIRHFRELLNEAIHSAVKKGENLGLILMDIDNFKKCNDTYGHPMGDEVLRKIAKVVASCNDAGGEKDRCVAARYGGEEMTVLVRRIKGIEDVVLYAEWIRSNVEMTMITFEGTTISVTLSLGTAVLKGDGSAESLIQRADKALYDAKHSGKNRVCREAS